jgi:tRNA A37 threonylcarbamoyladenosine dehydratase
MEETMLTRTELLLGREAVAGMARIRVIVFGTGGVGSWCAEALVRSGVRRMTIVDPDRVMISNVNRQLMATTTTVGRPKVEVMRERLLSICPEAEITAIQGAFTEATAQDFDLEGYDYVIDAIDSLKDKALLIETACRTAHTRLFSSMGAALKMDPTRVQTAEFWKVKGDPLARALRNWFKRQGRRPVRRFRCVYSDELLPNAGRDEAGGAGRANGSVVHVTAVFGLVLAGLVVQDCVKKTEARREATEA